MKLNYDFHIHSCLSPCGDKDMTPNNIVNMAKLMGCDVIALTDHNTSKNCPAVMKAGEEIGLTVIPGMELCTAEEVHIVCLFPSLEKALAFSDYVRETVPPIKNKAAVFGEQTVMDEKDEAIGEEEILLVTASSIRTEKVVKTVTEYGGFCFPAHIDRSSYSVISNLGTIDESFGFTCVEIFDLTKEEALKKQFPYLFGVPILSDSDAHYLENMRPASLQIEAKSNSIEDVFASIKSLSV